MLTVSYFIYSLHVHDYRVEWCNLHMHMFRVRMQILILCDHVSDTTMIGHRAEKLKLLSYVGSNYTCRKT